MDPLTLAAIGAGVGLLKNQFVDAPRERRDREIAATTQRYSPWTGMQAQPIKSADGFGTILQGGLTGASFGQSMEASKLYKDQLAKQAAAAEAQMAQNATYAAVPRPPMPNNFSYVSPFTPSW